jgi:hypothetical protein
VIWPHQKTYSLKEMKKRISLFLIAMMIAVSAFAGGETFPSNHWAYDIIAELIQRGYLLKLNEATKPYRRLDVAKQLIDVDKSEIEDRSTLWLFAKLENELEPEIDHLRDDAFPKAELKLGVGLQETFRKATDSSTTAFFFGRTKFSLNFGKEWTMYNSIVLDQSLKKNDYLNVRINYGAGSYIDQSFISYDNDVVTVKFGRDFLRWGYAYGYGVPISENAGSYDQLFFQLRSDAVRFTYFTAQLSKVALSFFPNTLGANLYNYIDRYMTAERIDFSLFSGKVKFGLLQSVIYGGVNRSIDWRFANPLTIYYAEQQNGGLQQNPAIGADFSFFVKKYNFYAVFFVDDWQANYKTQDDLKPNCWEGTLGLKTTDVLKPFGLKGTDGYIEFTLVTNRTFNQRAAYDYLKFVQNGQPMADPDGTDFTRMQLGLSHWVKKYLRLDFNLKVVNHGEGNLSVFTMPWLDSTKYNLQTGYHEPVPSGIVQHATTITVGGFYQPFNAFGAQLAFGPTFYTNYGNVTGVSKNNFNVQLRVYYNIEPVFSLSP